MDETEVIYGIIGTVPMGAYDPDVKYELLNLVSYDGSSYTVHTDPPIGTLPTDTDYWQLSAQGTSKATASTPGTVMPDGETTEVDGNGALSVKTALQDALGLVKGSNGIKVGSDGSIDVNTLFTQATELANIIAGEAISTALGKIARSIAVTMGLNENALLKSMLTNMDVNDSTKINSAAFIHTLVERIGMGTELTSGANLTAGLNALNSNLADVSDSLSSVKAKAPSDLAYISAFDIRINDQVGPYTASLISDITFMITGKELKSGAFGYSNVIYTDKPAGVNDWGYVEYFKHADNFVTVKIYPEDSLAFYIRRFDIGLAAWTVLWQKVQYTV